MTKHFCTEYRVCEGSKAVCFASKLGNDYFVRSGEKARRKWFILHFILTANSVSESLAESAAAYTKATAKKCILEKVDVKTGEESESNVLQVKRRDGPCAFNAVESDVNFSLFISPPPCFATDAVQVVCLWEDSSVVDRERSRIAQTQWHGFYWRRHATVSSW